ncbi:MAG: FIST N-terminal domain-containing protein [Patescibacteria group bacterium]|nr:FIST N-terminal domain-containing protein [Patescibacteria group bacterium]
MDKRIIIVVIVAILVGIGIWWVAQMPKEEKPIEVLPEVKPKIVVGDVGYGWSVKDDPKEAVKEAVSLMKQRLGEKSPKYVLCFIGIGKGNVGYDAEEVIAELRNQLGPEVRIHGGSSSLGVLTKEGFHIGEVGSLALIGVVSERMDFGVGGISLDELSPKEAGKKAIELAMENAPKEGLPQIVYMTASPGVEEEILPGIEEILGIDIPIIGGSGGDNDLTGKWWGVANDQLYKNGVVLTAVYTDLKIGYAYEHSYNVSEKKGVVTKAKGRRLYEIDGRPAAEVYNEWTGGLVEEILKEGGIILHEVAAFYPLARGVKGKGEEVFYISVMPYIVNEDKSLGLFANMEDGDEVLLLHGTWELLLNRAYSTPREAMATKAISPEKGLFGIYTFCTGTMFAVPETERAKFPVFVNNALGGIPFVGTFTLGEQIFLPGAGNRHCNLVNSMIVFSEE